MKEKIIYIEYADSVSFYRKGWGHAFEIDNEPKLIEIVKANSWYINKGYLYSSKLKKSLHRVVMEFYCGEEQVSKMIRNGWVIDHLNNSERHNCCRDNLCIIPRRYNISKGHVIDGAIERLRIRAAIGLYCLGVNKFQLAVGFNDPVDLYTDNDKINLATIKLNFNNFELCYAVIQMIILWLDGCMPRFYVPNGYATEIFYTEKHQFELTDEEKRNGGRFIDRDGKLYMNVNNKDPNEMRLIHKPAKIEMNS